MQRIWRRLREFAGLEGGGTLIPRWFVLRAVGAVYVLIFLGIIANWQALIGRQGIFPVATTFAGTLRAYPGSLKPFILAPSLFWVSTGDGMMAAAAWLGLAAAIAVVLNLWPRLSLALCWVTFLSFVSAWGTFSPAQLDDLMLETALLCIAFAPSGLRPGLGADRPPRAIALFAMRWLLFRIMFESAVVKIVAGDPHWRNFTALDIMYQTAPFPTVLGYLDHQLPHAYHLFEYALTFAAEAVAPLLAALGGRRGRWAAFWTWIVFQAGIQLTTNFGWLNTASIALGVIFLDDEMLSGLWPGFRRILDRNGAAASRGRAPKLGALWGLRAGLGLHFCLTLCYFFTFLQIVLGKPIDRVPAVVRVPRDLFWNFHSANAYALYARFDPVHHGVEFAGSNDGGATWRAYPYRYIAQRPDRICPFIAPWLPRFEASLEGTDRNSSRTALFQAVAAQLLSGNPRVIALFPSNPFPDRPPTAMRMRYYRLSFTDLATLRRTGDYWERDDEPDYLPMLYIDRRGRIAQADPAPADAALKAGDFADALAAYREQFAAGSADAGFRLAELYARGWGVPRDPKRAVEIYTRLAGRGEPEALVMLGSCCEYGDGLPVDFDRAEALYRAAAARGSLLGLYDLGGLYAKDLVQPADDVEGLTLLREAAALAAEDDPQGRYVRRDPYHYAARLESRMPAGEISAAERRAAARLREGRRLGGP